MGSSSEGTHRPHGLGQCHNNLNKTRRFHQRHTCVNVYVKVRFSENYKKVSSSKVSLNSKGEMLTYRTVCFELNEQHNNNFWQTPAIQNTPLLEHMATKVQWSHHVTDKNLPRGVGSDSRTVQLIFEMKERKPIINSATEQFLNRR